MGYMHINNLYKDNRIMLFKECFASEKIHGTSAHIKWKDGKITFFSGGEKFQNFVALFNINELTDKFIALGHDEVTLYGEAYGGKCQGMSHTYGKELKFIGFEVKVYETWLNMDNAKNVFDKMGLEFVDYVRIPTTIEAIEAEKLKPSVQAVRNGISEPKKREGVVLRPVEEVTFSNGARVISKHKNDGFGETKTPRPLDADKLIVLSKAKEIADEWVTDMRLRHVLDAFPEADMKDIPQIINAMYEDVIREAGDEIIDSKDLRKAIQTKTAVMFKKMLQDKLHAS